MNTHRKQLDSVLAKCQNGRNMLLISKNKYEKIVRYLKFGTSSSYQFKSWIQFHRFQLLQLPDEDQTEVLVVPKEGGASKGYVRVLHENQIYGKVRDIHVYVLNHGNYTQTLQSVSDLYHDISKDYISEFVRRCDCCQADSTSDVIPDIHLQTGSTMAASVRPMKEINNTVFSFLQDVSVNIIDMSLKPSNEFHFIGHVEDQFSNFSVLFPLKNDSSREIAKNLKQYFLSYFGPPKIFSSVDKPDIVRVLDEVSNSWKGDSLSFALDGFKIKTQDTDSSKSDEVASFIWDSICLIAKEGYDEREWSDWLPEIMLKLNVARRPSAFQDPYAVVFGQRASVLSECDEFLPVRGGSDLSAAVNPQESIKTSERNRPEEQSQGTTNTPSTDDPNSSIPRLNDVHVKQEPTSDQESERAAFQTIEEINNAESLSVSGKQKSLPLGMKLTEATGEYLMRKMVLACASSEIKQEAFVDDAAAPHEPSCSVPVDFSREDDGPMDSPHQDTENYVTDHNNRHRDQEVRDTGTSVLIPSEIRPSKKISRTKWHQPVQASKGDASRMDASGLYVSRIDVSRTTVSDPRLMTRFTSRKAQESNSSMDLGHCVEIDIAEEENTSWDPCTEQTGEGYRNRNAIHPQPPEIRKKLTKEDVCFIERLKRENPTLTLSEIKKHLRNERSVEVHISTVSRAIKRKNSVQEAAGLIPQRNTDSICQDEHLEERLSSSESGSHGRDINSDNSRKQQFHKNFLPHDEMFLTYLLSRKPYLTCEEIRERLKKERGLCISLHNLTKKISAMAPNHNIHENGPGVDSSRSKDDSTMLGPPSGAQSPVTLQGQHMMQPQASGMRKWTSRGINNNVVIMGENVFEQTAVTQSKSPPVCNEQLGTRYLPRKMLMPPKRKLHDRLVVDLSASPSHVMENGKNRHSKKFCHAKSQNVQTGCELVNQHGPETSVNNNVSPEMYDEDTELVTLSNNPSPDVYECETDQGSFYGYETRNEMGHKNGKLQPGDLDFLECLKRQNPCITLTEMKYRLLEERNLNVHVSSVCRALKKIVHTQEEMEPNYLVYINSQEAGGSAEYQDDKGEDSTWVESQFDESPEAQIAYSEECVQPSNSDSFTYRTSSVLSGNSYSGSPDYILEEDVEDEAYSGYQLQAGVDARTEGEWEGLEVTNNKKLTLKDMQLIKQLKQADPTITLRNIKAWLLKENDKDVHLSTVSRALKKMNGSVNQGKTGDVIDLTL
ncbi:uncharacterized protein [Haliotis cracherodii]|uniref:uncharacterized protein n=1 Tax=Haliotis cracherodii TaxID=6455 RepID=UPI0039E88B1C